MNRRGFLGTIAAALLAPFLPAAKPVLAFDSRAFAMAMPFEQLAGVTRLDLIYGFATVRPDIAVRLLEEVEPRIEWVA